MEIKNIERRNGIEGSRKLTKAYDKMQVLIDALMKKDIPQEELNAINETVVSINSFGGTERELRKILKKSYLQILQSLEEKLKFVPKHHYMRLGMVFGSLAGVSFPSVIRVLGFVNDGNTGMGISLGMVIGIVIGTLLDKKVEKDGRRLEMEP